MSTIICPTCFDKREGEGDYYQPCDACRVAEVVKDATFIQWKGTDVCMDIWCPCGVQLHADIDFLYVIKCPGCKRLWRVGSTVTLTDISHATGGWARDSTVEFVPEGDGYAARHTDR